MRRRGLTTVEEMGSDVTAWSHIIVFFYHKFHQGRALQTTKFLLSLSISLEHRIYSFSLEHHRHSGITFLLSITVFFWFFLRVH